MLDLKLDDTFREGKEQGKELGIAETIRLLLETMPKEQIAKILKMTIEEIDERLEMYPSEDC